jgi:HEAT repeat protein
MKSKDAQSLLVLGIGGVLLMSASDWAAARGPVPKDRTIPRELARPLSEPTPPEVVAKAFAELDTPEYRGWHLNEPPFPTKDYLADDYYRTCPDAIDLLIKTNAPVGDQLLRLAQSGQRLRLRYRAARILAARANPSVVPLLDRMCASSDDKERYLAWTTYADAIRERKLPAPQDVSQQLKLYAQEEDRETREFIEIFFGVAKTKAATTSLMKTLRANACAHHAVWSLGEIGDKQAVPAIIKAFGEAPNKDIHLRALGKLATDEAVDFLIAHLDEYGAVEGLLSTRSAKALPALRTHLEKLKMKRKPDQSEIVETRLAIIRLSLKDPREALLTLAENIEEETSVRERALAAFEEYDTRPEHQRILRLYVEEADIGIKHCCIRILIDSSLSGVTEAMIDHALSVKTLGNMLDYSMQHELREALNKRLGSSFRDMETLQKHLQGLQKREKKTK